jgi:hypothetical protein
MADSLKANAGIALAIGRRRITCRNLKLAHLFGQSEGSACGFQRFFGCQRQEKSGGSRNSEKRHVHGPVVTGRPMANPDLQYINAPCQSVNEGMIITEVLATRH